MREAEPRSDSFRRIALALAAVALCAYGYGQEQDPFIDAWKLVASQANQGRWDDARAAGRELEPGLVEVEGAFGWSLRAPIGAALAARDARTLARELTVAACGALFWKLESSGSEGLTDYYAAKYRVEAARTIYAELLAPAVRHQDATRGGRAHERVLTGLSQAQAALGRPGFLGRGRVAADAPAYAAAELEIEAALRAVFPFLPEVKR